MKKTILLAAVAALLFVKCGKNTDPFIITNNSIGEFTKTMKIKQVDSIFTNDSIVRLYENQSAAGTSGEVEIYEKGGSKLLLLSPKNETDPNSEINNIQIFDARYKTEKGLNSASTFKEVKDNYTVVNIESTINSVVVFLKETNVYLTIDKKHLPEELRYNMDAKVETTQIPDTTPFKYFMIGWDSEIE